VWDGNDLVHELADGAETVSWVFEPGTFAPLAKVEGERRYGVVTDHLGSPRMMTDEAGALAWKAQLDLFGVTKTDVALAACPWRWPGQYEDQETGLYYNRFRYYDPETGTYISQDPIGLKGGLHCYRYASDPACWIDPLGLSQRLCAGKTGPQLEAEVERDLINGGVPIINRGQKFYDPVTGILFGEIDVEVRQALIEVTTKTSGKMPQLRKYLGSLMNPLQKQVILFAPDYGGAATREAERNGIMVLRHTNDIIDLVR
jgi:RHS repeat-associated protein